jgi:hypothetical protein
MTLPAELATRVGEITAGWDDDRRRRFTERLAMEAERLAAVPARFPTAGSLATALDVRMVTPPHLALVDDALVDVAEGRTNRLMVIMPPQEGKSERVLHYGVPWMLTRHPTWRIGIASFEQRIASRWGRYIRRDIRRAGRRLGLELARDATAAAEWELATGGGVFCVGLPYGALTGRPLDCLAGGTEIVTESGRITIRDLYQSKRRPRVLSYNHATGRAEWKRIEAARVIPDRALVEVRTAGGRRIVCTPDHRIATGDGYRAASLLQPGDPLIVGWHEAAAGMPGLREETTGEGRDLPGLLHDRAPRGQRDQHGVRSLWRAVPDSPRGARETGPGRAAELLLLAAVRRLRFTEPRPAVSTLRGTHRLHRPGPPVLLGRVSGGIAAGEADKGVPAVRGAVPRLGNATGLLHPGVRQPRPLAADDRPRELPLPGRDELRGGVPPDAALDPRTGPVGVPRLRATSPPRPPHQRDTVGQPAREPDPALRDMPHGAPQVEGDTVSVVRRLRGRRDTVYDLQVEGNRNFFAGEVLVHNCLLIDDPIRGPDRADSELHRDAVWDWYTDVGLARLAQSSSPVVIVLTRWHDDDLAGRVLAQDPEGWRVLYVPAQAEAPRDEDPPWMVDALDRAPGMFLPSAREHRDPVFYERRRGEVGERTWAAQYQGRPTPRAGGVFQWAWIRAYRAGTVPPLVRVAVAVDPSAEGSDTAGIVAGGRSADRHVYVTHDRSGRMSMGSWTRLAWLTVLDVEADVLVYEKNLVPKVMLRALKSAWRRLRQQAAALAAVPDTGRDTLLAVAAALAAAPVLADPDDPLDDEPSPLDEMAAQLADLVPYAARVLAAPEYGPARLSAVSATRGKIARAEPAAQAYEHGLVHHVGILPELEGELTGWREGMPSPGRVDALAWLWYALAGAEEAGAVAAPAGRVPTGAAVAAVRGGVPGRVAVGGAAVGRTGLARGPGIAL